MKTKNYWQISAVSRMMIEYFSGKVYDHTLEYLTDCFVGIESGMQAKMVKFFIDEYFGNYFPPFTNKEYTGVPHIDRLLVEMLERIVEDEEQKERSDG